MISIDDDLASQDVWLELLESVNHCHKLFIYSRVIYLSFDEGLTCIADSRWLLVKSLPQDRSPCIIRSVAHDLEV